VLFTLARTDEGPQRWESARIVVQSLRSGERATIVEGGSDARYVSSGHILYASGGVLLAVAFDAGRLAARGEAIPVIEGVQRTIGGTPSGAAQVAVSANGHLVYVPGPTGSRILDREIVLADAAGAVTRLGLPAGTYVQTRVSRDGTRLAVGTDNGHDAAIWIRQVQGAGALQRLTLAGRNRFPVWSPDGARVAFQSDRDGDLAVFAQRVDGTGAAERLTTPVSGEEHVPESWSPDGRHLLVSVHDGSLFSLLVLALDRGSLAPFGVQSTEPIGAEFSPDGNWVAYAAAPRGTRNRGVYVQPFPATGAVYQAPKQGIDFHPLWTPDGSGLLYVPFAVSGYLAQVAVTTGSGVTFGELARRPAPVGVNRISLEPRAYDMLPDGRLIGLVAPAEPGEPEAGSATEIRVILNWLDELKRFLP
jgi:hypothetical protein